MKTYARINGGVVAELFDTDGDIREMFHPDLIWVDVTDISPMPQEGWTLSDGSFNKPAPPPLTAAQILSLRDDRLALAALRIAPLEDAVSLGEATAAEEAALLAWRRYRVAWNRIDQQPGFPDAVQFPADPSVAS